MARNASIMQRRQTWIEPRVPKQRRANSHRQQNTHSISCSWPINRRFELLIDRLSPSLLTLLMTPPLYRNVN